MELHRTTSKTLESKRTSYFCPAPYDHEDWFWQGYGEIILPLTSDGRLNRFWFTRYGALNNNPYLLLRYEANAEITQFAIQPSEHKEFDIAADLCGQRFLGSNQRCSDAAERGGMIFDFLHKTALLTLAQLSHKDAKGYWVREQSTDRGNNHFGSPMESVHHLFCNSSATPVGVAVVNVQNPTGFPVPMGLIQAKNNDLIARNTPIYRVEH